MKLNFLQVASMIAVFQALLIAVFSLRNTKGSRTSNGILAAMLFIFAIHTGCVLYLSIAPIKFNTAYHKLFFVAGSLAFLVGPLLYLYIRSLLEINFSLSRRDWLHGLPFLAALAWSAAIVQFYKEFYILNYPGRIYISGFFLVQTFGYLLAIIIRLRSAGLDFRSFLSYIDNSRLAWVRFFISGYIIVWLIQFQLFIGWDVLQRPSWCPYTTSLYFLSAFLFFNAMIYIALKKPEVFSQTRKYSGSALKANEKNEFKQKLNSLMQNERLYLDSSISLAEVAQKLEIHPIYVSQIINETFRQNFREYINSYRIEESKRLLTAPGQTLNILGVALDAGFNSKASFNRAFKKHTGSTPKEYKKRRLNI